MKKLGLLILASSLLAALLPANTVRAQNGTWTNTHGGSWTDSTNWQDEIVAHGIGNTADFSTLSLNADATVTLDGALTIGNLILGDQAGAYNWILNTGSGGPLTLSDSSTTPSITVNNETTTIGLTLAGTQGLNQNGNGTLVLVDPAYAGGTTNNAGTLELLGSLNTYKSTPLSINSDVQSGATLSLDVDQNGASGSMNVIGGGTLTLIATNNGPTSPDLYFGPDHSGTSFYGAQIASSTLDLGASQRYFWARSGHNSVARYLGNEDCRIAANIIGTGGITYIAQMNWPDMETPLTLIGANTFTGEVEIQRGSIYLLNAQALVQNNKLLLDPAGTNNARFFLYGNGATVANLESGGSGNALIANGNPQNFQFTIPAGTLTVNQTSNTTFGGVLVDTQSENDNGGPFGSSNLSLVINGTGTLTLTGTNTYTGSTAINGGELVISPLQTGGGAFSVADGAALGIIGINGNTVPMSDLALGVSGNTTVEFTFSGSPVSSFAPLTTSSLEANGGANSVTINIHGAGIPVGQFPLIQYTDGSIGGSGAGFSAFQLGTLPPSVVASLVNDTTNNSIDLQVTTGTAPSLSGTWTNTQGGSWPNSANWQGGNVAQGIGNTADFSTLSLGADATVTLDGARTIGNLVFGDQSGAHNWILNTGTGGPLTLNDGPSTPSITVNNETTTIGLTLTGSRGLNQNGNGTLVLVDPAYSGGTTNNAGTLELLGSLNTYKTTPLSINTEVQSGATLNLDVDQNGGGGSMDVIGGGTLTLISTSNSPSSPDLYFGPDHSGTEFYGTQLDASTLDLGASQRYIFSRSGHNSVSIYLGNEDCRIAANIIGAGGLTYIAQMNFPDMEVPLTLFGANTFTGKMEIQRGSIYIMNAQALVQTNKLLLDPQGTNNARFFVYGNGATVANLESSGSGNALIANGNPASIVAAIPPGTLTVNQTSNTTFGGVLVDTQSENDGGSFGSGNLSLVINGTGTLTLTGTNTYTGSTAINGGELVISPLQTGGGAFSVADGAALGIIGINGNTVPMSDLALGVSGNTTLELTFSGSPVSSFAPLTTSSLEANGGANSVTINIHGAGIPVGQFPLIQYTDGSIGGSGAGFSAFQLGTLPPSVVASLVNDTTNNSIDLQVTTDATAPSLSGTWTNTQGGSWPNSANWQGGNVAQGIGNTADFSTLSLGADATVTLDGARTIGNLVFGDQAGAHNWILNTGTGGPLTLNDGLSTPSITVNNQTATIALMLTGTQGLNQNGNGTLVLGDPAYSGGTTNNTGILEVLGSLNTYKTTPLSINTEVQSAATLNLDVNQNGSAGSINVIGGGTLTLIGTNNGPSSPDLYFCPDQVGTAYYGAQLDPAVLDLGVRQRYIWALSGNNSISRYNNYADSWIGANIIGTGGLTYIAQNNQYDMEAQLVLAGANTFTGEVEIQRGSIYLLNAQALVQTNKLLLDPAGTNNARLFVYGNGATVANLESSGAGNALIANGNPQNFQSTIPPGTLTVNQTSNTTFAGVLMDTQYENSGGTFGCGNLSLALNGTGTLTLTGTNTYTGSTMINGGELVISPLQTGGGAFSLADGAALGITGINSNTVPMSDLALGVSGNTTVEFTFGGSPSATVAPVTTASLEANGSANSVTINIHGAGIPSGQYPLIQYTDGSIGGSGAGFSAFHLGTLPSSAVATLVNNTTNNSIDLNITSTAPGISGVLIQTNGTFSLTLTGAEGTGFTVHATTNLALTPLSAWTVVGTGTIGAGPTTFNDLTSTNYPDRFYLISTP